MSTKKTSVRRTAAPKAAGEMKLITNALPSASTGRQPVKELMKKDAVLRQAAHAQMIDEHKIDRNNLVEAYGDPEMVYGDVHATAYDSDGNAVEIVQDRENGPLKLVLECNAFRLNIHPIGTIPTISWAIVHANSALFSSPHNEVIAYLLIPFRPGTSEADICLGESIYWFKDGMVIAKANINQMYLPAIIVAVEGLIIPVGAVRDRRMSLPITPSTEYSQYATALKQITEHGEEMKAHNELWINEPEREGDARPLPDIAVGFNDELAKCIDRDISSQYDCASKTFWG